MNKPLSIFGTIMISAGVSIGVYFFMDYLKKSKKEQEVVEVEDCADMNQESDSTVLNLPEAEKKKIFKGFRPFTKTYVAKKLLKEIEERDICITIELKKGE